MSRLPALKSTFKTRLLLALYDGEKKVSDLEKITQTVGTTILHAIKELEQMELTTKTDGIYKLTPLGILEAQIYQGCYRSLNVLEKYKDFWLTHDVSCIPSDLMMNIGAIENSNLVKSTDIDLQKVHETFVALLSSAKTILGISPIFHPDFVVAIKKLLAMGSNVTLIVTSTVLERLKQTDNDMITKYLPEGNLQLFLNDNITFGLTITEQCWSLGLSDLSRRYDYTVDLICCGDEGLKWGHQLFRATLEKSKKI